MAVPMLCECGARFDVEECLVAPKVPCPDCGTKLDVPPHDAGDPPTSLLALAALGVAIVGAFTLVGPLVAAALGLAALRQISLAKGKLDGRPFALAAVGLGLGMPFVTVTLLNTLERGVLGKVFRRPLLAGQVEVIEGNLSSTDGVVTFPSPSPAWLKMRSRRGNDPSVDDLQTGRDLVLVHPARRAYVDLRRDIENQVPSIDDYRVTLADELSLANRRRQGNIDGTQPIELTPPPEPLESKRLPDIDGLKGQEWIFETKRGGQTWRFLIHVYRDARPGKFDRVRPMYVLRAYAPPGDFAPLEKELRAMMAAVRLGG